MYIYTDAPASYDYDFMVDSPPKRYMVNYGGRRIDFRVVWCTDDYRGENFQIPRYRSGMYLALTEVEFDKIMEDRDNASKETAHG